MDFSDWLLSKYVEWRGASRRTLTDFAAYIGVSQQLLDRWIRPGGSKPSAKTLQKLADKFPDVYDVLGLRPPARLPGSFGARLKSATDEAQAAVLSSGLDPESPAAEQIIIQVFERWGFKYFGQSETPEE